MSKLDKYGIDILILWLILITAASWSTRCHALDMNQPDKQLHALVGFGVSIIAMRIAFAVVPSISPLGKIAVGIGSALLAGYAKEVYDGPRFDVEDIQATILGGALGTGFVLIFGF